MLIFKENIYRTAQPSASEPSRQPCLNPYNFLFQALVAARDLFVGLNQLTQEKGNEQCKLFFPHASRFATLPTLNLISKRLLEGLVQPDKWYQVNAYHLCYMYDSLHGIIEEYSYEGPEQRENMFPELQGASIDFNFFLDRYFFNTAFLIDQDRFNNMDAAEKKKLGFVDPCLFGAINKLIPSEEEIILKETGNPYLDEEIHI